MDRSLPSGSPHYELWKHLHDEHGLTLLESELQEIVHLSGLAPEPEALKRGDVVTLLMDAAFAELQHDTGPTDPEWVAQRRVLKDAFTKILARSCSAPPPEAKRVITPVFIICNAYESGFGHGRELDSLPNPYTEGSQEHEAYAVGYNAGEQRRRNNGSTAVCLNGEHQKCRMDDCMCKCHAAPTSPSTKFSCPLVGCTRQGEHSHEIEGPFEATSQGKSEERS